MSKQIFTISGQARLSRRAVIATLIAAGIALTAASATAGQKGTNACSQTAKLAFAACGNDVQDN
jgi:hypothetical protein